MIPLIILGCISLFYLLFQNEMTRTFEITDANNYLYIAHLLDQGKVLYRDIFLDNFPLATYTAWFYHKITFGNIQGFFFTGAIEGLAIVCLLYYILLKKTKNEYAALLGALTFFSSFVFIRTTTSQTGIYTAILFFTISYLFFEKKKFLWSGVFVALAILTKAYLLPLGVALFISILFEHKKETLKFVIGGVIAGLVVMLPTILFALPQFISQTFHYGLVRSTTESKMYILVYFMNFDFIIGLWVIAAWFLRKTSLPIWIMGILTPLFFFVYKDFYYIYLVMIVWIGSMSAGIWLSKNKYKPTIIIMVYAAILICILLRNGTYIISKMRNMNKLINIEKVIGIIKKEKPDYLYGPSVVVNGFSYLSGIPPYKGHIDVTAQQFGNGNLDKTKWTEEVVKTNTILVYYGSEKNGQMTLDSTVTDLKVLRKHTCRVVHKEPIEGVEAMTTHIVLIKCVN
jgi:hypothetical protein